MRPFLVSSVMALRAPPMSRSLSWRGLIWAAGGGSAAKTGKSAATVMEQQIMSTAAATRRGPNADIRTNTPSVAAAKDRLVAGLRGKIWPLAVLRQKFGVRLADLHGALAPAVQG